MSAELMVKLPNERINQLEEIAECYRVKKETLARKWIRDGIEHFVESPIFQTWKAKKGEKH